LVVSSVVADRAPAQTISVQTEQRIALVVGNASYQEARLRNSVNDAAAVAQALSGAGFKVILRENADRVTMYEAIVEFGDRLREGKGVGLFYFSGHGMQVDGRNYMVPVGARIASERMVETEAIDVNRVLGEMDAARGRVNIVILDACRDNPYARAFRSPSRGLAPMDAPQGTLIAYATAPGKVALDGVGANSPYTSALVKQLAVPGLSIESLFKRVRVEVLSSTNGRQQPWESSSLIGEFFFTPPPEISAGTSARERPPQPPTQVSTLPPTTPHMRIGGDDGAEMVLVPAGDFLMGSRREEIVDAQRQCRRLSTTSLCDRFDDEVPSHVVFLDAFYIDRYEITNARFSRFVHETGYRTTAEREGSSVLWQRRTGWVKTEGAEWRRPKGPGSSAEPRHPVVHVSWYDAEAYCTWSGNRLPTEAEWEKAARGTDRRKYPWGDAWDSRKANAEYTVGTAAAVGSYPAGASPYGVEDLAGNLAEWVADWFDATYYKNSPERNPQGPTRRDHKVLRGGSWDNPSWSVTVTFRRSNVPTMRIDLAGFRCARDAGKYAVK
jgi:formylglycine-generating enzyme required for sulfatase activity